jgi:hypothetical protein
MRLPYLRKAQAAAVMLETRSKALVELRAVRQDAKQKVQSQSNASADRVINAMKQLKTIAAAKLPPR